MKPCKCRMFTEKGICYHTGYRPTLIERKKSRVVPLAIQRMENRIKHPSEIAEEKCNTI